MESLFPEFVDDYVIPHKKSSGFSRVKNGIPCDSCNIKGSPVPPKVSSASNPIMIIGLYPGVQEDRAGQMFVGDSGIYLHQTLLKVGFTQEELDTLFYETNIIKCKPTQGVEDGDLEACGQIVLREIENLNPALIILCGELPVRYLIGK